MPRKRSCDHRCSLFGGGKNLCPGRAFAIGESLGLISALALGFEIEGAEVPEVTAPTPGGAMRRPVWGTVDPSVKIRRRSGYEDVTWSFKLRSSDAWQNNGQVGR